MYFLANVTCGGITMDAVLPNLISTVVNVIKIGVPIILIIFGMIDFGKAVMAQKDEEIKKGQQIFFKRAVAAIAVFLIVAIVQLVFGIVANASGDAANSPMSCVKCFVNGAKACGAK